LVTRRPNLRHGPGRIVRPTFRRPDRYDRSLPFLFARLTSRFRLFNQFFSSVRRRGTLRTLRISWFEFRFGRKFSAGTAHVIHVSDLDLTDEARAHAQDYFPSSYLVLHEALARGPIDCRERVFVDYGCGMGRVLLFASTLPFKTIIGVELSSALSEIATANLERHYKESRKTAPAWRIVTSDARHFDVPDDASVFYFFNPFDATILSEVADRLVASVKRAPRRCFVVYAKPVHDSVFSTRGFMRLPPDNPDFVILSLGDNR
jgi:predicted RNA methylase